MNARSLVLEGEECETCGRELQPPEHTYCSICVSGEEHTGDLSWGLNESNNIC